MNMLPILACLTDAFLFNKAWEIVLFELESERVKKTTLLSGFWGKVLYEFRNMRESFQEGNAMSPPWSDYLSIDILQIARRSLSTGSMDDMDSVWIIAAAGGGAGFVFIVVLIMVFATIRRKYVS